MIMHLGKSNFCPSGVVQPAIDVYGAVGLVCNILLGVCAEKVTIHNITSLDDGFGTRYV